MHNSRPSAALYVLAGGTAANHVRALMLRLGVSSRAQIAAWVVADPRRRATIRWARASAPKPRSTVLGADGGGTGSVAYASRHAQ